MAGTMAPRSALCLLLLVAGVGAYRSPSLPPLRRVRRSCGIRACDDLSTPPTPPPLPVRPQSSRSGRPVARAGAPAVSLEKENARLASRVMELEGLLERTEGLCELLDDEGACSKNGSCLSDDGFAQAFRGRGAWLLGLLALQSCSSFVLAGNEALLASHPSIVFFLTMLVGAGGNAGNQAAATGDLNPETTRDFLIFEAKMAFALSSVLLIAGVLRTAAFGVAPADTIAIALSLFAIVSTSVLLGAVLPLILNRMRIDAAHAATSVQVLMDILGVLITCAIATALLDTA